MRILSHNEQETENIGETFATELHPGQVIAYLGTLGAGKTAFTRGLARGLGCSDRVSSPTFTIVNEYEGKIPLFHFDMYRLTDADALFEIGWEDYLSRGGICAVEWSERVTEALPQDAIFITLSPHESFPNERWIDLRGGDVT